MRVRWLAVAIAAPSRRRHHGGLAGRGAGVSGSHRHLGTTTQERTINVVRASGMAALLLLAPGACGDGEPAATTTVPEAGAATTSSTAASSTRTTMPATTKAVRLIEVTVAGGQVAGGVQRPSVRQGELVRIRVTSDAADEVHVHTYDLTAHVGPGQPAQIDFVASIPGRHEVELEEKGRQLLVLVVR